MFSCLFGISPGISEAHSHFKYRMLQLSSGNNTPPLPVFTPIHPVAQIRNLGVILDSSSPLSSYGNNQKSLWTLAAKHTFSILGNAKFPFWNLKLTFHLMISSLLRNRWYQKIMSALCPKTHHIRIFIPFLESNFNTLQQM